MVKPTIGRKMSIKIGIFVGSLRGGSYSRKVARQFAEFFPEGYTPEFFEIGHLPFYNEDLDYEGNRPHEWVEFRTKIRSLDGLMFFTPEYNRSIPAVLKNALDVGSRPGGQSSWGPKPGLVVSVSPGGISGFGANHHLRQSLVFLDIVTLQQPEAYIGNVTTLLDDQGEFTQNAKEHFEKIVDAYFLLFKKQSM